MTPRPPPPPLPKEPTHPSPEAGFAEEVFVIFDYRSTSLPCIQNIFFALIEIQAPLWIWVEKLKFLKWIAVFSVISNIKKW